MNASNISTLTNLALVGVGLYVVVKVTELVRSASEGADHSLDLFAKWVAGKPARVLATIIFKDGATLDVNRVHVRHDPVSDQMRFSWNGRTYRLLPRQDNNYYPAVPV